MSEVSKKGFPYPLQMGSLEAFCHPDDGHELGRPFWDAGEAVAASGYVAVRVDRGLWHESDFERLPARVAQRLGALPWGSLPWAVKDAGNWRDLAEANLFKFGAVGAWLKGKPAPTRVVRVNDLHLVRLSFLQLVARLPRVQVYMGVSEMLLFRFSGGVGIVAKDARLTEAGFSVLTPARHEDGTRVSRPGPCVMKRPEPWWKKMDEGE